MISENVTLFYMSYITICVIVSAYSDSLVITSKPEVMYGFHAACHLVLYPTKNYFNKRCIFLKYLLPHKISEPYNRWW